MITLDQKEQAYAALRAAGFEPPIVRELLAGPKGLRDEFAGLAMNALVQGFATLGRLQMDDSIIAHQAYALADAMMRARSEP